MVASLCWPSSLTRKAPGRGLLVTPARATAAPPRRRRRGSSLMPAPSRRTGGGHVPPAPAEAMAPVYTSISRSAVAGQPNPDACASAPRDSSASRRRSDQPSKHPRPHLRVVPVHQHAGEAVPDRGAQPADGGRHHRRAARLSLERHQAERFRVRRHQHHRGGPVPVGQFPLRARRLEPDAARRRRARRPARRAAPARPTSDPLGPPTNTTTSRSASAGARRSSDAAARSTTSGPFSGWIRPAKTSTIASGGQPEPPPRRRDRSRAGTPTGPRPG